jgi:hypothetical protein
VLESVDFLTPGYVSVECDEQVSSKGNLGNNLVTDGADSWGQNTASGAGVGPCRGNLMATVELLFEVTDSFAYQGSGIRENGQSVLSHLYYSVYFFCWLVKPKVRTWHQSG